MCFAISVPQTIARTLSDMSTEDQHHEEKGPSASPPKGGTQYHEEERYTNARPPRKPQKYDASHIPMKGDTVEICYSGGIQHDPVRVITSNYQGDARVRYNDVDRGGENKVNLFRNRDISFQITQSVYDDPDVDVK